MADIIAEATGRRKTAVARVQLVAGEGKCTINKREFADYVNSGYAFSGNYVKLGDDVSVSTMAGTSDANSFQGTFDGDGQTLTFTKGTSAEPFAEEYCAPFRQTCTLTAPSTPTRRRPPASWASRIRT